MRTQRMILQAVAWVAAVLVASAQADPVHCEVQYQDGLSLGSCSHPPTITIETATVKTGTCSCVFQPVCYEARINAPYVVSLYDTITLPWLGKTYQGGYFDQEFCNTTKTHEDWHFKYDAALAEATYGALETWSSTYVSNGCTTEIAAWALGNADMERALAAAKAAFDANVAKDRGFEIRAKSSCHIETINGKKTWRSVNPDWGQAAVAYASSVTVRFTQGPGDCAPVPVPEPLSMAFMACAFAGVVAAQLRRRNALKKR